MKKIYIVRHGQTDYNKNNIIQGALINAPLNETGKEQAEALFQFYNHIDFGIVYTSDLVRTQETVQQFLDKDIPHIKMAALNEISWGIYDGKHNAGGESSYFSQMIKRWNQGETDVRPEEGQSPEDLAELQLEFIEKVKQDENDTILVCMHGRAMRILLCQLLGEPLHKMDQYKHHNTCLYLVTFDGTKFAVEKANDLSHLEAYQTENQLIF